MPNMGVKMRLSNVIIKPVVTEKSVSGQDSGNVYTFKVNKKASKGLISQEIERLFGVDVIEVKTTVMPGKRRRIRNYSRPTFIKTDSWKKAMVTIKSGQKIDLFPEGGKQ